MNMKTSQQKMTSIHEFITSEFTCPPHSSIECSNSKNLDTLRKLSCFDVKVSMNLNSTFPFFNREKAVTDDFRSVRSILKSNTSINGT